MCWNSQLIGVNYRDSVWVDRQIRDYVEKVKSLVVQRRQEFMLTVIQKQVCDATIKTSEKRAPGCVLECFRASFNLFIFLC